MSDLAAIRTFPQLVKYLRDELDWPITSDDFEHLTFDYTPQELGIDSKSAAKILEIKRLRSLSANQPWGVFFVKFEPKRLPIVALRRILSSVALKRRASANSAERKAWEAEDLLFISNYGGEGDGRQITFAHFSQDPTKGDLPTLKVLGWDNLDTPLHIDHVAHALHEHLHWPENQADVQAWRTEWSLAFALRYREVVATSRALAIRLAELARAIRDRINTALEIETEDGPLTTLMRGFQESLVHDLDADGFADMYAQTIAYGLLSARIANPKAATTDDFMAQMPVTNPFLKELLETFLQAGGRRTKGGRATTLDFDELGVSEVVELLDRANMEAVIQDFGDRNPREDPVIHFYELFLKEYDAKKRMQRGVFYTPRPIVSYIVRSVHELLQSEFGLADGLADVTSWADVVALHPRLAVPGGVNPTDCFISVLDPATGTGTFLVEVIDVIHRTLIEKWRRAGDGDKVPELWNEYVPRYLLPRLFGYELLMAPYAIAHMKIGLKLIETGYQFESRERARVYLTNSLEPPRDFSGQFAFAIPALAHEAKAVNEVKRSHRFTVVVGNPPYAGHSLNNNVPWIVDKVHDYSRDFPDLQKAGQGKWLQDDYVKFFRLALHHLGISGAGISGLITNNGFLDNATFRGMRKHTLDNATRISLVDLRGSVMKREKAADGAPDENVFDIQQSVAISLVVNNPGSDTCVDYTSVIGPREGKYVWLTSRSLRDSDSASIGVQAPFYLFIPSDELRGAEYLPWATIPQLFNQNGDPAPGIVTTHDEFAISWTKDEQIEKVNQLLATPSEQVARGLFRLCTQNQWNYQRAKATLRHSDWMEKLVQVLYRPFDIRWTVYDSNVAVHRRERVNGQMLNQKNLALAFMRQVALDDQYSHFLVSRLIVDNRALYSNKGIMFLAPLYLLTSETTGLYAGAPAERVPNVDPREIAGLADHLGLTFTNEPFGDLRQSFGIEDLFNYVYALFHSPSYRTRYAQHLKIDFPRLPLTPGLDLFTGLARLGRELIPFHLVEAQSQDGLSAHYDKVAGAWRFAAATDARAPLTLTFAGAERPMVESLSWSEDTVWIDAKKTRKGPGGDKSAIGTVGFRGVSEEVWNFHVGGYQVCHKWLKDRKGRALSADDIAHYYRIIIGLHETIRLMGEIDVLIDAHGGWPDAFQLKSDPAV